MLNRRELEVMNVVYSLCDEKGICLVSPTELLSLLPPRKKYDEKKLESILNALALDDYFELLSSDRKGEKTYVISLHVGGYAYKRCWVQRRRDLFLKLGWAIASAIIAFLVGWVLRRIF